MSKSSRRRARNRRNARFSTGPKTAEGKARSSQNATKHGLFSARVVLDGEDQGAFDAMRGELVRSMSPQNGVEWMLLERMVSAQWRLLRLERYRVNLLNLSARINRMGALDSTHDDEERLARHEQRLENTLHRCLRQFQQLRKNQTLEMDEQPVLEEVEIEQNEATEAAETPAEPVVCVVEGENDGTNPPPVLEPVLVGVGQGVRTG